MERVLYWFERVRSDLIGGPATLSRLQSEKSVAVAVRMMSHLRVYHGGYRPEVHGEATVWSFCISSRDGEYVTLNRIIGAQERVLAEGVVEIVSYHLDSKERVPLSLRSSP